MKNECKFTGIDPDSDDSTSKDTISVVKAEHPKPQSNFGKGVPQSILSSASNFDHIDTQRTPNEIVHFELEQSNAGVRIQHDESSQQNLIPMISPIPVNRRSTDQMSLKFFANEYVSSNAYKKNLAD